MVVLGGLKLIIVIGIVIGLLSYTTYRFIIKSSNKNTISFEESFKVLPLPVVTFRNNGKELNFLVDSGATDSVISKCYMGDLNYTNKQGKGSVFGMEGNAQEVSYINTELEYKDHKFVNTFQVVDLSNSFNMIEKEYGVKLHGVLGSDFLNNNECITNYINKIVKYGNHK